MDDADASLTGVTGKHDDSVSGVAEETDRRCQGALAGIGGPRSQVGLTSTIGRILLAPGAVSGEWGEDIAQLRSDVDWVLSFLLFFFLGLVLLFVFRR